MMRIGKIEKYLKKSDLLSVFISCMIHDFEHPGYSNQFVIRTKHPLAIRYSDISVIENHHLAAAFEKMFTRPNCNIIENLSLDMQMEVRHLII